VFIIPEDKGGETRPFVNQYMYKVGLEWVGLYSKIMSILTKGIVFVIWILVLAQTVYVKDIG